MSEQHSITILYDLYKSNNELIRTLLYLPDNNNINNLISSLNERNSSILNVIIRYVNTHITNNFLNNNLLNNNNNNPNNNNIINSSNTNSNNSNRNRNRNRRRNTSNVNNTNDNTSDNTNNNSTINSLVGLSPIPISRYIPRTRSLYMPITTARSRTNNSDFINSFFEPVEVYPSRYQVERATRQIRYGDIENPLNNSCPISLERFGNDDTVTIITHCNHIFVTDEINNWFRSNCRCPVCRYDIREYSLPSNSTTVEQSQLNTPLITSQITRSLASPLTIPLTTLLNTTSLSQTPDASNNYLVETVDRLLNILNQDSSFNYYLNPIEDSSNNDLLATFYFTYR